MTPAVSVGDALDKLEVNAPDLIISETKFATELDGFELRRRLLATQAWSQIPFIFLTAETAIENKIKGLELGVDDYLTKPIYIKEIITRINILLQKRQRQFLDAKKDGTRFAGRVADMPVVDVIQTIEVSRKSGVIQFSGGPNRQAAIFFRDGKVIDAEAGTLQGEDAVYRLLTWNDGEFEVEFRTVRRREAITTSSQGLLMEGMRRLDEWSRLLEQLPSLSHRFEIDAAELVTRLGEVPDENNRILRLFDGKRALIEVIDASDFGDLECLQAIARLYFEGMLIDLDQGTEERPRRDTGRPMPLAVLDEAGGRKQTPIEVVASGPIDLASLEQRASAQEIPVPLPVGIESGPVIAAIEAQPSMPVRMNVTQIDSGPVGETSAPVQAAAADVPAVPEVSRSRRDSGEIVSDQEVLSEEEAIPGPLLGGYRQSSLRLIDEAVAAAQLIEPSLFSDEELAAAGVTRPAPAAEKPAEAAKPGETPLARLQLEKVPANGSARRRPPTAPPPIPVSARLQKEIDDAPMLDADLVTSGEHRVPSEAELAAAELVDADLDTSVEEPPSRPSRNTKPSVPPPIPSMAREAKPEEPSVPQEVESWEEDSGGVPRAIEGEDSDGSEIADEGPTDPSRRRFAATLRREDSQAVRMIGSHGKDRAEASGELKPLSPKGAEAETQREVVTIMPRRNTREIPLMPDGKVAEAKAGEAEAKAEDAKPAVESPSRPPPRRVSVAGGVVKGPSGPGKLAMLLLTAAAVLIGATLFSYCSKKKPTTPVAGNYEDAAVVAQAPDARVYSGFGIDAPTGETPDATRVVQQHVDAAQVVQQRPDAAQVAMQTPDAAMIAPRPDAAQVVMQTPDAAVVSPRPDATQVASTADAGVDKTKEAKALYDKAHTALEDGDPQAALDLLDKSLAVKKMGKTYMEKARALQRMQKTDEALAAVDEAIKMKAGPSAYEQKGMMLWAAQRYAEARAVLEQYLEMDPTGKRADTIRSMLEENK